LEIIEDGYLNYLKLLDGKYPQAKAWIGSNSK
jgi:hypothetical protein